MQLFSASIALLAVAAGVVAHHPPLKHIDLHRRATSPDNTCGPKNGFSCDPKSLNGGPCCSSSGFCGSGDEYCGVGCQSAYGSCGSRPSGAGPSGTSSVSISSSASTSSCHVVPDVGVFSHYESWDFTTLNSLPQQLVATSEDNLTPGAPYHRIGDPDLVSVSGGYLNMKVPGGQTTSPIRTAQIQTTETDILYASVRTTAILSPVQGVCNGFFFYNKDAQEIDIEYLSDSKSTSNPGDGSTPLQLTNHGAQDNGKHYETSPIPSDATTKAHEYRTDWVSGAVSFYIDGKQIQKFQDYVPTEGGEWIWNNWSDGDPGWSVGPPVQDSILKIPRIEMYYNVSATNEC